MNKKVFFQSQDIRLIFKRGCPRKSEVENGLKLLKVNILLQFIEAEMLLLKIVI